jgi:radical SAM-linked protein
MEASSPALAPALLEARQRWRVVYRRRSDAPALPQRDQLAAWEASVTVSGLPLAGADQPVPRPRLVFAAPLGVGVPAEREMVDLFLVERREVADVRLRLAGSLPGGHELVTVHDVWLGEPPLSGQVVAADYRAEVHGPEGAKVDRAGLDAACRALLDAPTLARSRDKGGRPVPYDMRPLIADVALVALGPTAMGPTSAGPAETAAGPASVVLRIRTRFDPARGVGRPDEVVAALSELSGTPLVVRLIVRERLILRGEV